MNRPQLLALKKKMRAKLPRFVREDIQRKEVSAKWRKPQGQQNKVRKQIHGHVAIVRKGYRTPAEIRGYTIAGHLPVRIYNENDVQKLTKENSAIIASGVGNKKKVALIKKLTEKGIKIQNIINPQEELKNIQTELENRKKSKQEKAKRKEEKREVKKAKEEKPLAEKVEQTVQETDKKEQEKKELDKLLTSKEN
ncbi:MAG: eL32 family ribosomal protein [Nanoarchaeota archaeon]